MADNNREQPLIEDEEEAEVRIEENRAARSFDPHSSPDPELDYGTAAIFDHG